ncbi:hypothetical protein INR49_000119 [Caranx melampygus]|nr:hypothetical protein INR49_000119 [Caranx melampygus]
MVEVLQGDRDTRGLMRDGHRPGPDGSEEVQWRKLSKWTIGGFETQFFCVSSLFLRDELLFVSLSSDQTHRPEAAMSEEQGRAAAAPQSTVTTGVTMEKPVKEQLLGTLKGLGEDELDLFKWYLQDPQLLDGFPAIEKCYLEDKRRHEITSLMYNKYTENSMKVATLILNKMQKGKQSQVGPKDSSTPAASAKGTVQ